MRFGGDQLLRQQLLRALEIVIELVDRGTAALHFKLRTRRIDARHDLPLADEIALFGKLLHHHPGALGDYLRFIGRIQIGGAGIAGVDGLLAGADHFDRNRFGFLVLSLPCSLPCLSCCFPEGSAVSILFSAAGGQCKTECR